MIHPKTELKFINDTIGYGVVAKEFIPAGTITWVLDKFDRAFSQTEVQAMDGFYQDIIDTYAYRNNKGEFILCWDNGRFVNHSFNSNCLTTAYDFEIAIRDIQKGEQLTDDYGYLNVSEPFDAYDEGTERKTVYPDDLVNFHKLWDKKLLHVFGKIIQQNQPLKVLISDKLWSKIENIIKGDEEMDSILTNYFRG
ncbi:SET domain-containing protein [Winogradskyella ursingii]|uniref:SET domain-containing protein n=1 Tax=Winogradskyella ursingii TaxID=2686079 RepID=UPI0015C8314E|nr:SET domain-containing protein [Winogradskyella ursingii]